MNATKFHDDGNCLWHYKNQWGQHTKDPNDWYYTVSFETKDGGYLTGGALTCQYWESRKLLQISNNKSELDFYVENFSDVENILLSLMKAYKAKPYPIYKSKMSEIKKERRSKLNKINKLNKK